MRKNIKQTKDNSMLDEDIRKLVIARLKIMSPNTIKCVGDQGSFNRDELIESVEKGNRVGKTIEKIEMEWLKAQKTGIVRNFTPNRFLA
jgi:hypothetical protein